MKLFWTGTDSLMMIDTSRRSIKKKIYWQIARIVVRMIEPFLQNHIAVSPLVKKNLEKFGVKKKIEIVPSQPIHDKPYPKRLHPTFNVLYYFPNTNGMEEEFNQWLYGWDIVQEISKRLKNFKLIVVDGTQDMKFFYPITDFILRPNRHDGEPRMIMEAKINNIPYYHSYTNPDIEEAIKQIKNEIKRVQNKRR